VGGYVGRVEGGRLKGITFCVELSGRGQYGIVFKARNF